MTTLNAAEPKEEVLASIPEEEFFINVPPGQVKLVSGLTLENRGPEYSFRWKIKDLLLHCVSEECSGLRRFQLIGDESIGRQGIGHSFVTFRCRNCNVALKRYAITTKYVSPGLAELFKYGEVPQFGPPTPSKVLSLMGGERELFLKGRRCENQGLGVAAFAYYRRVVENQKVKIIGEILKVADKLNADPALIEDLKAAKQETRFTQAIDRIKHGLPEVLLINGYNPLTLLHSALSEGLHAESDEQCLELATSIRVVLTELVDRMALAVKEEAALTTAVQRLLQASGKAKG